MCLIRLKIIFWSLNLNFTSLKINFWSLKINFIYIKLNIIFLKFNFVYMKLNIISLKFNCTRLKLNFYINCPVLVKDRTPPSPLKKSRFHTFVQIVSQYSETNKKSIFRFLQFLFFELWLILFTIFQCFYRQIWWIFGW